MDRFKLFDQRYSLARAKSGKYSKECCDIEKYWEKQYKFDVADDDRVVDDDLDDDGDNDGDYYDNDENTSDSEEEYIDDEYEVLCVCSESSDSNNSSCSTVNSTEQKDNEFDLLQFLLDDFFNNANTDNWGNEVYRDFRDHFDNKYFTVTSLRQILEKCPKFDINYIPYNQSSIFMETIKHHRLDLTRLLLDEFNVDVDAMHSRGTHTALHDCIIDGDHRAIRLLIEYGFDLTAIDKWKQPIPNLLFSTSFSPLLYLFEAHDLDINQNNKVSISAPRSMEDDYEYDEEFDHGKPFEYMSIEAVRYVFEHGLNLYAIESERKTNWLHGALSSRDRLDVVEYLLTIGADLYSTRGSKKDSSPIAHIVNDLNILKRLMKKGVLTIDHVSSFVPEETVAYDSIQYLQTEYAFTFPPIIEVEPAGSTSPNSRKRKIEDCLLDFFEVA